MKHRTKSQFTLNQVQRDDKLKNYYSTSYRHIPLPTSRLESSQGYQRKVDPRHVDEIIANFNPLYLDEIIVSYRDGKYFVVDGQNRIAALIKMNGDRHCLVNCKVFQGLTYEDEAAMFYHLDMIKNKLKYHEKVKAMSDAGDNPAVQDIKDILSKVGLRWSLTGSRSGTNNTVSASAALIDSFEMYGGLIFYHAMDLLVRTWHGDGKTLTAPFIKGICLFARTYAQRITVESFVKKLNGITPGEIRMAAQQEITATRQDMKYAKAFLKKYNFGRTAENRLPDILEGVPFSPAKPRQTALATGTI